MVFMVGDLEGNDIGLELGHFDGFLLGFFAGNLEGRTDGFDLDPVDGFLLGFFAGNLEGRADGFELGTVDGFLLWLGFAVRDLEGNEATLPTFVLPRG
jgi:hypothetical protein